MNFRKWLEDTGQVFTTTNTSPYEIRGIGSKYVYTDKKKPKKSGNPDSLFKGKKRVRKKKKNNK